MTKPPAPGQIEALIAEMRAEVKGGSMGILHDAATNYWADRLAALAAQPVAPPDPLWPKCKWCGSDLERYVKETGTCPKCGAIDFNEPRVAAPANPDVREDDMPLSQTSWAEHQKVCAYCSDGKADCNRGRKLLANLCEHPDCDNQKPCPVHQGDGVISFESVERIAALEKGEK